MKYSKVKSIIKVNSEPVYHITVEKNHNFFANNMCVHNCDYRGEIGLIIINTDPKNEFIIRHGDRIAQGVINEVKQCSWNKVNSVDDLCDTERGQGGFSSTGIK